MTTSSLARKTLALAIATVALALEGCAQDQGDDAAPSLEALAPAASVAPSRLRPLVTVPAELGRATAIRTHDYADGVRQEIRLDGATAATRGNTLTVFARSSRGATLDEVVPLAKPTEATIRVEIAAAFPRLAMRVVERASTNAYGPYGLAIGRARNNERCAFFWQWIDADRVPSDAGLPGPLAIRAAVCRSGTSFDAMAASFDRLAITRSSDTGSELAATDGPVGMRADGPATAHMPRAVSHRPRPADRPVVAGAAETMHYRVIGAAVAARPLPALVSDLPPEALSGPKLASKQE